MNNRGLTLVELMVAAVIFTTVALPLMASISRANADTRAADNLVALSLMEQAKSKIVACKESESTFTVHRKIMNREWRVTVSKGSGEMPLYTIEVFKKDKSLGKSQFYK